jgi:hypothetical protein
MAPTLSFFCESSCTKYTFTQYLTTYAVYLRHVFWIQNMSVSCPGTEQAVRVADRLLLLLAKKVTSQTFPSKVSAILKCGRVQLWAAAVTRTRHTL